MSPSATAQGVMPASVTLEAVLRKLQGKADREAVVSMARFGIRPKRSLGLTVPEIREIAREIGRNHTLAQQLWATGIHEARVLAAVIDEPAKVTAKQMDRWARDFDSWGICDACCWDLFDKTAYAFRKAVAWSSRREEYVKRGAFALMAALALHDKGAKDDALLAFLPLIRREAGDGRNFVKKAVSWALRQIGKRNRVLNGAAIRTADEIRRLDSPSARWIASDALRELKSPAVQRRLAGPRRG